MLAVSWLALRHANPFSRACREQQARSNGNMAVREAGGWAAGYDRFQHIRTLWQFSITWETLQHLDCIFVKQCEPHIFAAHRLLATNSGMAVDPFGGHASIEQVRD